MGNAPDSNSPIATQITITVGASRATSDPDGERRIAAAADGYEIAYRTWSTENDDSARGTIILFNGITSHALWFRPLVAPLLRAGLKLVGVDRRGTGMNAAARGDAPSAQGLIDDARTIAERERLHDRPLHVVGWCWGALLAINVAAELARPPSSLILLAPGLFPTETLKRRLSAEVEAAKISGRREDEACLASPITDDMFTAGPALASFIAPDAQKLAHFTPRFHAIMARLGMSARLHLPRLTLPSLVILASRDLATDNPETIRGLTRLTGGRASFETIDGAHGLQFDAPDALAHAIVTFAARAAGAGSP